MAIWSAISSTLDVSPAQAERFQSLSLRALAASTSTSAILLVVDLSLFLLLRGRLRQVYSPRSTSTNWVRHLLTLSGNDLAERCGYDGYFYLRFITATLQILGALLVLLVPCLVPINVYGNRLSVSSQGLHILSWPRLESSDGRLSWIYLCVALVVILVVLRRVASELVFVVQFSVEHASGQTGVLLSDTEETTDKLKALYGPLRHDIKSIQARGIHCQIEFATPRSAQIACKCPVDPSGSRLAPHLLLSARDIRAEELQRSRGSRLLRRAIGFPVLLCLLLLCSVPAALAGSLSQLTSLTLTWPWLSWLNRVPLWFASFLQGVLPQAVLMLLDTIMPPAILFILRRQSFLTNLDMYGQMQSTLFAFLFLLNFFTVSLSSSITSIAQDLSGPLNALPLMLASHLPMASNYFASYILLHGMSSCGNAFLRPIALATRLIRRATHRGDSRSPSPVDDADWCVNYCFVTCLACISIIYSVIIPMLIPLAIVAFLLQSAGARYSFLYVSMPTNNSFRSLFPRAMFQLFTGVYVMELCLLGLFLSVKDGDGGSGCLPQAAIMSVAMLSTAVYHFWLRRSIEQLLCAPTLPFRAPGKPIPKWLRRLLAIFWPSLQLSLQDTANHKTH